MIRSWSWFVRNDACWLTGHCVIASPSAVANGAARPFWSARRIPVASPKLNVMSTLPGTYRPATDGGSQTSPTSRLPGFAASVAALKPASHSRVSGVFVWTLPSSTRCLAASSRNPSTPISVSQKRATSSSSAVTAGLRRLRSGMPSQNTP